MFRHLRLILILVFLLVCVIIVLVFFLQNHDKKEKNKEEGNFKGICSFDIDKTLTCGTFSDLKATVQACKDKNYALTIVTARFLPILFPIDTNTLGFPDNFPLKYGKVSFNEKEQANTKTKQLNELLQYFNSKQKYQISKHELYFFDDKKINIDIATQNGFTGIHVDNCNLNKTMVH